MSEIHIGVHDTGTQPQGRTWDITQLQEDFEVLGFGAPFVAVRRKADGKTGTLEFTHHPRVSTSTSERTDMSQFTVHIATDNAAFSEDPGTEIARILRELADTVAESGTDRVLRLRDINGARVGFATDTEPAEVTDPPLEVS